MRSCSCPAIVGGRCARCTPSCGTPTTWPTSPARRRRRPGRSRRGGRHWTRRSAATPAPGRGSPPWPTPWRGTPSPRTCSTRSSRASRWTSSPAGSRPSTSWPTTATTSPRSSASAACTSGAIARSRGEAERLAEHCGIALQLTNILRDVRDDARAGRIYLPRDDLARFGVEPDELAAGGRPGDRVRELLAFEGRRAYEFYEDARRLVPAGRSRRPARAPDHRRHLPRPARRDCPPRLQRPRRPDLPARLAQDRHRAGGDCW